VLVFSYVSGISMTTSTNYYGKRSTGKTGSKSWAARPTAVKEPACWTGTLIEKIIIL
jgi:hypothetical protein